MRGPAKAAVVYAGLLVVLLGATWVEWTAEPEIDLEGKVMLVQGSADEIERVTWKGEKDEAVIERKVDALGTYYWVTYTKFEDVKPAPADPVAPDAAPDAAAPDAAAPDAAAPDAAAPDAAPAATPDAAPLVPTERVPKVSGFKAGTAATELATAISPLLAIRKLDAVAPDKLVTIGLDDASRKDIVEIARKGRTTVLEVGGEAYGTRDRYVRNQATGEIYLVDDETLRPLKYARTRLPDRTLTSLEPEKVATAVIEGSGTRLEVSHVNPQDKANEGWSRGGADAALDPELKTWMEQLFKMKGTSYAEPSELPANLEYRFKVAVSDGKDPAQTLEFSQAGADGDWFVQSEHTRGLVKLLRGPTASLYEDVEGIISGG